MVKIAKNQKKEEIKNIEGRGLIKVSIFSDEWEKCGIEKTDTLKIAVTKVRAKNGLPERYKLGGGKKTAIRSALKDATPEQIVAALETLTAKEEVRVAE